MREADTATRKPASASPHLKKRQLRICLPFPRLGRRDRCRGRGALLHVRDLCRDDRWEASVVNNALRPFPIGVNADDVGNRTSAVLNRQFRKIGIRNKQQREQHSANIVKISREGHWSLHLPRHCSTWQALIDCQTINEWSAEHCRVCPCDSIDVWTFQYCSIQCTSVSYVAPRAAPCVLCAAPDAAPCQQPGRRLTCRTDRGGCR